MAIYEIPSGTVDGTNATFTALNNITSEQLFVDRMLQVPGTDYTLSNATITFQAGSIPPKGALLRLYYPAAGYTPPVGGDLTTLANVRAHLQMDPAFTSDDAWLSRQITAQSSYFLERADRFILSQTFTESIDGSSDRIRTRFGVSSFGGLYQAGFSGNGAGFGYAITLENSPVSSVTSVTIDGGDSTGALTPVPAATNIGQTTQTDGWVLEGDRIELVGQTYAFTPGIDNIVVVYVAGYSTVPAEIEDAVIDLVAWKYQARNHLGQRSKSQNGENITFDTNPPASVETTLRQYQRIKH